MYQIISKARALTKHITLKGISIALPVVAFTFVVANFLSNGELLNRLEAIPSTYLSSNTTAAAQAAGTLFTALSSNGFTLGSSALVNSSGVSTSATSFTYTSDGNTSTPYGTPHGAAVTGNYLFISHNGDDRIAVYDISTTDSPTFLTTISTSCTIGDIEIYGTTLYVTNYTGNNFRVYDLSASTTAPTFVRTVTTGTYPIGIRASAAGYIYVANNTSNTISIFNASTPTNPTLSSTYTLPSNNPTGLAIKGTVLYVAHYDQALVRVLNISAPTAPSSATTISVGTNPLGLAVFNNILLVANYTSNNLHQWNITTPLSPTASTNATFSAGGTGPSGIAFSSDGKEAYIVNKGSNSFTSYNIGKEKYVAWNWKCGSTSGCTIVTYTGDGSNTRQIPHSLGAKPAFYFTKNTDGYNSGNGFFDWSVYHQNLPQSGAANTNGPYSLWLHNTLAASAGAGGFDCAPTSTYFCPNQTLYDNVSGRTYQAYLFAEKPGFSKFGSYTGNGSSDGPFVYTGFKPRYILFKRTDAAQSWHIRDTARDLNSPSCTTLQPNGTNADQTDDCVDINANGFKLRGTTNLNVSAGTYIYAAFAEYPFEYASTNGNGLSIATSTRFNGTNGYLSRTPSLAGNQQTWTWSGWVKRGTVGTNNVLYSAQIVAGNSEEYISFNASDKLQFYNGSGAGTTYTLTAAVFRDPSVWMHVVFVHDSSNADPASRGTFYVNGVKQKNDINNITLSRNSYINSITPHAIGRWAGIVNGFFSGYVSDSYLLDGQAVAPTAFASADSNGRWSPKTFTGSYVADSATNVASALSNGFNLGAQTLTNTLNDNYIAWNWKESPTSGFDIVTYTGTGANRTVAHSLGATPAFMLVKRTDSAANWTVWHQSMSPTTTAYSILNTQTALLTSATMWNSTAPTTANISLGTDSTVNANGGSYTAYIWAEKPGFSKFGTYTGNGSTDGPFVYTGFKPRWVMINRSSLATDWVIWDTARDTVNPMSNILHADLSNAAFAGGSTYNIDANANGFKIRCTSADAGCGTSAATYIYAAFAEYPFEYASTNSGLTVASSTRFNGTNAYLTRTPTSVGDRKTWTWSGWVKRGSLTTTQNLFDVNGQSTTDGTYIQTGINSSDDIGVGCVVSAATQVRVTGAGLLRDPSKWYHIVVAFDTTQATAADRVKLWVDGTQQTLTGTFPSLNNATCHVNNTQPTFVGVAQNVTLGLTGYWSGYISDTYLIDGQALTPTSFAQSDTNGRWSPKAYSGAYGQNGFRLQFASSTTPGLDTGSATTTTIQTFASVGTTTFTVPNYVGTMTVEVWGAGGSGAQGACLWDGSNNPIGPPPDQPAANGSSFNGTLFAGGGGGGAAGCYTGSSAGGAGGTASGGDVNTAGTAGVTPAPYGGGAGGSAPNGGAGGSAGLSFNNGYTGGGAGTSPGAGGGGGGGYEFQCCQGGGGGGGSGGYVKKFYAQGSLSPGATTTVVVGGTNTNYTSNVHLTGGGVGAVGQVKITYSTSVSNNFTNNNIAATDNVADTPTNNFATINPLSSINSPTLSSGNLTFTTPSGASGAAMRASHGIKSGKWYWEVTQTAISAATGAAVGIQGSSATQNTDAFNTSPSVFYYANGTKYVNAANSAYGASFTNNDVIGVAYDADAATIEFFKNGVSQGSLILTTVDTYIPTVDDLSSGTITATTNFGQGGQSGLTYDTSSGGYFKYTPPTGFKALSSANMITAQTTSTTLIKSNNWFDAITYTGTGAVQSISSLAFQPDLVWIKDRTSALNHVISDAVTGITCYLSSNTTTAKTCATSGNSFHLPLMGTSSAASIGTDTSGAGNFFTNNNVATTDFVIDTPTNNFATFNPIAYYNGFSGIIASGNLFSVITAGGSGYKNPRSTIPVTGKSYVEFTISSAVDPSHVGGLGLVYADNPLTVGSVANSGYLWNWRDALSYDNGSSVSYGSPSTTGDTLMMAVDYPSGKAWIGNNGTWFGGGDPATGVNPTWTGVSTQVWPAIGSLSGNAQGNINFGQGGQSGLTYDASSGGYFKYAPPSGFKALSSANMIAAGTTNASLVKSNNWFDAITYEGNGTTKVISTLNFQPDFIWIKSRTSAVNHVLYGDGTTITNAVTSFFQWFEF